MDGVGVFQQWADLSEDQRAADFRAYAFNIAEARYVMRRVTRIVNDAAKAHDLDPLLHQALLQIYGTREGDQLAVSMLADRLDVPAAFASRLAGQLQQRGLAERNPSTKDRRVTLLSITETGIERLREVDRDVHYQMAYFQHQLQPHQRIAALAIFAFYVGVPSDHPIAKAIGEERDSPA